MSINFEFCVFKLVEVLNFSSEEQFWFFGPNLTKKGISSLKQKNWASILNSAYCVQISLSKKFSQIDRSAKSQFKITILILSTKFSQKAISGLKHKKWTPALNSTYSD